MRYRSFDSRVKDADLAIEHVLMQGMHILDHAAKIAIENEDTDDLVRIYESVLDANDRMMHLILNGQEEEEVNEQSTDREFGFVKTSNPSGPDREEDGRDQG